MPECPTCGRQFGSRRGLGVHHSAAHDELLPNRECAHCSDPFHSPHEKKYCSEECRDAAVSYEGANNPNYRGGTETAECEICGTAFEYYPSDKEGRYCGSCVESERWRHRPNVEGVNNPRWSGGPRQLECHTCGVEFLRPRKFPETDRAFCTSDCQYAWLSEAFTGDGHPNWTGGGDANYGRGWSRVRERALERDDYRCIVCGKTKEDLGRNPDVHHIVPVRAFVETPVTTERDAHHLENVVSLCIACHRMAEFGRISRGRLRRLIDEPPV